MTFPNFGLLVPLSLFVLFRGSWCCMRPHGELAGRADGGTGTTFGMGERPAQAGSSSASSRERGSRPAPAQTEHDFKAAVRHTTSSPSDGARGQEPNTKPKPTAPPNAHSLEPLGTPAAGRRVVVCRQDAGGHKSHPPPRHTPTAHPHLPSPPPPHTHYREAGRQTGVSSKPAASELASKHGTLLAARGPAAHAQALRPPAGRGHYGRCLPPPPPPRTRPPGEWHVVAWLVVRVVWVGWMGGVDGWVARPHVLIMRMFKRVRGPASTMHPSTGLLFYGPPCNDDLSTTHTTPHQQHPHSTTASARAMLESMVRRLLHHFQR